MATRLRDRRIRNRFTRKERKDRPEVQPVPIGIRDRGLNEDEQHRKTNFQEEENGVELSNTEALDNRDTITPEEEEDREKLRRIDEAQGTEQV